MNTVAQVIDAFGYAALATKLGIPAGTVSAWKSRNSVPSDHWLAIAALAKAEGKDGVTLETLAQMHSRAPSESGAAA
jgi:uncharacterized protein YjcR